MNPNDPVHPKLRKLISLKRRELASQSPEIFAKVYLQKCFSLRPSRMHQEIFALIHPMALRPGTKLAIAAPRGHAKSTLISLALVLHCVCYKSEQFIFLCSSTVAQAENLLKHIQDELTANEFLLEDFPDVCEPVGSRPGPPRWRRGEIITRNDVRVTAVSANTKLRGRRHRNVRPGLVICDDLETDTGVASETQRLKLEDWFSKAVLNCGTTATKFIVIGTILHYDALLAKLIDRDKSPAWTQRKYQAIEIWDSRSDLWDRWAEIFNHHQEWEGSSGLESAKGFYLQNQAEMTAGTQVLWPEREDYYALRQMRLEQGQASFDSEKQNEPIDLANCLFRDEDLRFWEDRFRDEADLLSFLNGNATIFGACDPSMGKAGHSRDDSAIITLARDGRDGKLYVLDADIARREPSQIIKKVIEYQHHRQYAEFAMESTQFQEFLATELLRHSLAAGCPIAVRKVKPVSDKLGRIQSLQPLVRNGAIIFSKRHRDLLDQLRHFPKAAHDDGPDALHMAVEIATHRKRVPSISFARQVQIPGTNLSTFVMDDQEEVDVFTQRFRDFLAS